MRTMFFTAGITALLFVGCQSDCHRTRQCGGCHPGGCAAQPAPEPVGRACVGKPACPGAPCAEKPAAPCAEKPAMDKPCVEKPGVGQPPMPEQKPPVPAKLPKKVVYRPADPQFGHAEDFSWLRGQLRRVHVTGGSWKIRYKPIDEQDRWGGSVVLSEDARIDKFEDGDFVYVTGEIIVKRPTVYLAGPLYRVSTIRKMTANEIDRMATRRLQGTSIRK